MNESDLADTKFWKIRKSNKKHIKYLLEGTLKKKYHVLIKKEIFP